MRGPGDVTRRRLLIVAGGGAAALVAGRGRPRALARGTTQPRAQEGIATPPQSRLALAAFDLTAAATGAQALADMLRAWTATIAARTVPPDATPQLTAAALTITVGFGPSLFDERFGLAARRPPALAQLPAFPRDMLSAGRSGGDLVVQACAHDPAAAANAVAELAAAAAGTAQRRWSQMGYRRTSRDGTVTRNLMGFRDGTATIRPDDRRALRRHVWADEPAGMAMGTYLVARRIRMHLRAWEAQSPHVQERAVGREPGAADGG